MKNLTSKNRYYRRKLNEDSYNDFRKQLINKDQIFTDEFYSLLEDYREKLNRYESFHGSDEAIALLQLDENGGRPSEKYKKVALKIFDNFIEAGRKIADFVLSKLEDKDKEILMWDDPDFGWASSDEAYLQEYGYNAYVATETKHIQVLFYCDAHPFPYGDLAWQFSTAGMSSEEIEEYREQLRKHIRTEKYKQKMEKVVCDEIAFSTQLADDLLIFLPVD